MNTEAHVAPAEPARLRYGIAGAVAAVIGVALFGWALAHAGLPTIADGIRRVGAGFLIIVALGGLRFWVRARAWALATEASPPLTVRDTFPALVAGDALGNLTPLGVFLSETAKAAFIRTRISLMAAIAGIAVENLIYTLSVVLVIAGGTVALAFLFDVSAAVRQAAFLVLAVIAVGVSMGLVVLVRQIRIVSPTLSWLNRRGFGHASWVTRLGTLQTLEDLVYGFATRHPGRTAGLLSLELVFHILGVIEMWITLALLAGQSAPTLLSTFVLESVNRTIMVVFKFVPLRLGVDELGTELLTRTLGLPVGLGVTMAVLRKARMIIWSAVGIGFLIRQGFTRRLEVKKDTNP